MAKAPTSSKTTCTVDKAGQMSYGGKVGTPTMPKKGGGKKK